MLSEIKHKLQIFINILSIVAFLLPVLIFGQDKIHLNSGIILEAKVQQVGETNIQYKKFNNQNGPLLNVKKVDVKMITYENGRQEIFTQLAPKKSFDKKYLTSNSNDAFKNSDIIKTIKNEDIFCLIDLADNNHINYHIDRIGPNPASSINSDQVYKYYKKGKWFDGYGNSLEINDERTKARQLILNENKVRAIKVYGSLIEKDSTNSLLMAEGAYALALAGLYDGALYRLDRCWSSGTKSPDLNFFTAQVFALMGYDDLANEFWKESEKNKIPEWIKNKYKSLLLKNKRNNELRNPPTPEETTSKFNIANSLAADDSYIQSIGLFQEITYFYPNDYLPYVGYSITLEKAGALNKSIEAMQKAISLLENTPDDNENRKLYEERLSELQKKTTKIPVNTLPGLYQVNLLDQNRPQVMTYAGGMVSANLTNFNLRFGYFITGKSNAAIDFNYSYSNGNSRTNFGLSYYTRSKIFVTGLGLSVMSFDGESSASYKISVGISLMNKKKSSSFDVFVDANNGFKTGSYMSYMVSVGTSLYLGRRK